MDAPHYPPSEDLLSLPPRRRGLGLKVALVGAGIAAGAITATAIGANATTAGSGSTGASTSSTSTSANGSSSGTTDTDKPRGGGADGHAGESSLSAALTAKLKAAALKAVPGGTVERVESDSGDATYETHMTKADGSRVTVKFNKSGAVTAVESGMGK